MSSRLRSIDPGEGIVCKLHPAEVLKCVFVLVPTCFVISGQKSRNENPGFIKNIGCSSQQQHDYPFELRLKIKVRRRKRVQCFLLQHRDRIHVPLEIIEGVASFFSSDQQPHAGDHFIMIEWFEQVMIGACFETS